jgi:hypothetical protein
MIQTAVLKTFKGMGGIYPVIESALASALPLAIQSMSETVTSEGSSVDQRAQASISLFWLFSVCQRHEQSLARSKARTEMAKAKSARAQAKKARAVLLNSEIPFRVAKERKKLQRVLDKVPKVVPERTTDGK